MKPKSYIFVCCLVMFCVFLSAAWFRSKEGFDIVPTLQGEDKTQYILHQTEMIPREKIRSFAVANGQIYILYDNAALVNVYGTDGTYKYGIQIATIKNGHSDIAVVDGKLYIESRRPIIFVFQGAELIETLDPYIDQNKYLSTRTLFFAENTSNTYEISASGSTIVNKSTQETVIALPPKSKAADYLMITGLVLLFLSLRGYTYLFGKRIH